MDFSKLGFGAIWLYVLFIPMGWGLHIYRRLQRRLSNIDTCQSGLPILLLKARPLNLWAEWHEVAVKHWYTPVWASQSTFWSNTTESVRTVAWGGCQTLTHASLGFPFHFLKQGHWISENSGMCAWSDCQLSRQPAGVFCFHCYAGAWDHTGRTVFVDGGGSLLKPVAPPWPVYSQEN